MASQDCGWAFYIILRSGWSGGFNSPFERWRTLGITWFLLLHLLHLLRCGWFLRKEKTQRVSAGNSPRQEHLPAFLETLESSVRLRGAILLDISHWTCLEFPGKFWKFPETIRDLDEIFYQILFLEIFNIGVLKMFGISNHARWGYDTSQPYHSNVHAAAPRAVVVLGGFVDSHGGNMSSVPEDTVKEIL